MGSSPGFVSTPCHSCALFRLAFATAPAVTALTWRQRVTRRLILQKARRHTLRSQHPRRGLTFGPHAQPPKGEPRPIGIKRRHSASTACRHTVSGSISLPSPGIFSPFPHGTCTLSVARKYLALGGGPPCFPQDFPCPVVLKVTGRSLVRFCLRDCHPLWFPFPAEFS
jgi:hypothetical protein